MVTHNKLECGKPYGYQIKSEKHAKQYVFIVIFIDTSTLFGADYPDLGCKAEHNYAKQQCTRFPGKEIA